MKDGLRTRRLQLEPFELQEAEAFFPLFSDEETMRYMHVLPHKDPVETRDLFASDLGMGAEIWTVRLRGEAAPVGSVHFLGGTRVPGMGYIVRRDLWGRGLATEAISAVLTYAFNQKRLDRVELWINEGNGASQRVAEKLGFRLKGRIHQRYDWEENHHIMRCYGLWADEWPEAADPPGRPRPAVFGLQPVLLVRDVGASIAFYRDRLGFGLDFAVGDPPAHAGLARGNWSADMAYLQVTQAPEGVPVEPQGWLYIMVEAGIDGLYEEVRAAGAEVIRAPETYPWGMREFTIRDPDGYELRFGTREAGSG